MSDMSEQHEGGEAEQYEAEQGPVANELRQALADKAASIEPRADSYVRLTDRLDARSQSGAQSSHLTPRVMAFAAVLVVVAVAVGALLARAPGTQVSTTTPAATSPSPTTTPQPEPTVTTVASTAPSSTAPAPTAPPVLPDGVVGPIRATKIEAAEAFLSLINRPHGELMVEGSNVEVFAPDSEAPEFAVTSLTTGGSQAGGYWVIEARAEDPAIFSPAVGDETTGDIRLVGRGTGFESSVTAWLYSASDGSVLDVRAVLAGGPTSEGNPEPDDFATDLAAVGSDHAWVVVADDSAVAWGPFSAVPITFAGEPDPTSYVVTGISVDDPDNGLALRHLPGRDEGEVLRYLAPGSDAITRNNQPPAVIRGQIWRNITVANSEAVEGEAAGDEADSESNGDPNSGWVNSRYLISQAALEEQMLQQLGAQLLDAAASGDAAAMARLPWSESKFVKLGWIGSVEDFDPGLLATEEFWQTTRSWSIPPDFDPSEVEGTYLNFMGLAATLGNQPAVEITVSPAGANEPALVYGNDKAVVVSQFPGARHLVLAVPETDQSVWHNVHVFIEPSNDRAGSEVGAPRIVGLVVELWVP